LRCVTPGQAVDVREHLFLVATSSVSYDWFNSGIWFTTRGGDDSETHYPLGQFMDRFFAPQYPGLLLLHSAGNGFVRYLAQGETILVKPTSLLFKDPTVQMQLHFERPAGGASTWTTWGQRYLWFEIIWTRASRGASAYEHMEDNGRRIVNDSGATSWQW